MPPVLAALGHTRDSSIATAVFPRRWARTSRSPRVASCNSRERRSSPARCARGRRDSSDVRGPSATGEVTVFCGDAPLSRRGRCGRPSTSTSACTHEALRALTRDPLPASTASHSLALHRVGVVGQPRRSLPRLARINVRPVVARRSNTSRSRRSPHRLAGKPTMMPCDAQSGTISRIMPRGRVAGAV